MHLEHVMKEGIFVQEKSIIKAAALMAGVMILCSCANSAQQSIAAPESSIQSSGALTISSQADKTLVPGSSINHAPGNLNNLTDVTNIYVAPLSNYCLTYSWTNASEINANDLIDICGYNNLFNRPAYYFQYYGPPLEYEVETALQKHFDVDVDYLRTSSRYNAKSQTYNLYSGDRKVSFGAISATQKGNQIEVEVGLTVPDGGKIEDKEATLLAGYAAVNYKHYQEGMLIFPSGTLTVELTEDNVVKYVSYQCNQTFLKEKEKLDLYRKYAEAFLYQLGSESWDSAEQIEPDAFVVYYIYLCGTGEITMPQDGLRDEEFGNPYMFADILEKAVMKHFDVSPEHIRKSEYYDRERNAYWSGGIGTTVDMEIVGAEREGNQLTLTLDSSITSSDYNDRWNSKVALEVKGDTYQYISYTSFREDAAKE